MDQGPSLTQVDKVQILLEEENNEPERPVEPDVDNQPASILLGVGEAGQNTPLGQTCPAAPELSSLEGVQAGLESKLLAHDGENLGEVKDGSDSKMHVSDGYIGCSENKYYLPFSAAYAYTAAEGIIMDQDYDPDSDNSDSETEQPSGTSTQTLFVIGHVAGPATPRAPAGPPGPLIHEPTRQQQPPHQPAQQ